MLLSQAKKLKHGDLIQTSAGYIEMVYSVSVEGSYAMIRTQEGYLYNHRMVKIHVNDLSHELEKELDYEDKIRNCIIKIALVKPPETYTEKKTVNLITKLLKEYAIII